jgi:hypothetical protein
MVSGIAKPLPLPDGVTAWRITPSSGTRAMAAKAVRTT